ncbi:MAG: hypothetical protein RIR43_580 [Pseudomonadota bacterium]|jgi:hypothetical protein
MGIITGLNTHGLPLDAQAGDDAFTCHKPTPPKLERETGIEPASLAWKAKVLPLNYSRLAPALPPCWATRTAPGFGIRLVEEAGFEPA